MKTIGVLGGLGPQATMEFEARVHQAAQRLLPQHGNSGYPPMVVYYCRHAPVLVDDAGAPLLPIRPDPRLFEAAAKLGTLADFLVITSNGVHYFAAEIERAAGRPVLSMIDLALAEVRRRGWEKVGVLGMGEPIVYRRPLSELSLDVQILNAADRGRLDQAILSVMAGAETDADRAFTRAAVQRLWDTGADGVILGCTELPLLLRQHADAKDLLNPGALLAEAAVRHAAGMSLSAQP